MPQPLLSPADVISQLEAQARQITAIVAGASPAYLKTPPAPGEWSAVEILGHLRACSDMWGGAIRRILAEDHPTFRAVNPRTWIKKTDYLSLEFSASFAAYREQRAELVELLQRLPAAEWERSATVVGAGKALERSVLFYADWLGRHERAHVGQIERALAALRG